jgi:hypothetical protein
VEQLLAGFAATELRKILAAGLLQTATHARTLSR